MADPKAEEVAREKITAAAIRIGPNVYTGPHHHTIIHYVAACTGMRPVRGEQGFVTSEGRFVGRSEARVVAVAAGQAGEDTSGYMLMSEDLWIVPDDARSYAAEVEKAALERAAKAAEAEPELPGPMPDLARLAFDMDPQEFSRGIVRVTKRNIASAIRALLTPEPGDPQERPTHDGGNP